MTKLQQRAPALSSGFMSIGDVKAFVGNRSEASIRRWMRAGLFPAAVKVATGTAIWRKSDLDFFGELTRQRGRSGTRRGGKKRHKWLEE